MTNNKKSLVTIKVVDAFGYAIPKAQYEVKNQKTGQLIASGATNSAGCIVEISRDKGTILDVYVKSMFNGLMLNVKSFTMSKDRMLVTVKSPKVLLDLKTLINQGANGAYRRKTHIVKKGETLTSIAKQNGTTVRALERLNKIDDPDKISVGQVIKLPVNIPANGNHTHQDKSKPKPTNSPKPSSTSKPQSPTMNKTVDALDEYTNKAKEWLSEVYEDGKKAMTDTVESATKILTVEDRSQESGTPKTSAPNICKTNPQCISSGKSELIREVNIRLAGFGGALPTDEFTELTAKCIKQFQRDYMGVPETGKICGSLLVALDKFYFEYKIGDFFTSMTCNKCHACSGFGNGRKGVYTLAGKRVDLWEPPGLYRPLIWLYKAIQFYMKKDGGYKVVGISSGYRCVDENIRVKRSSINHMGCALDILIADKNGKRVIHQELQDKIRVAIIQKYTNAVFDWVGSANRPNMESYRYGAKTWLHIDTRDYDSIYEIPNLFAKTVEGLNGDLLVNIAKTKGLDKILSCSGSVQLQSKQTSSTAPDKLFDENDAKAALRVIYDTYGKDIAIIVEKMYRGETTHFKSQQYKYGGTPGMEVHGPSPYYGWDSNLFTEAPIGTWSAYEGKGLSGVGGNAQVTKSKKVFVCVSSVLVGMNYVAKYIKKHNGNYARWFSTDASKQAVYREHMGEIKAKIVPTFD